MRIVPLIQGVRVEQQTSEGVLLPGHTGAVTLIEHGNAVILVDTGGMGTDTAVGQALWNAGEMVVGHIRTVILTHFHLDHSYNLGLFPEARIIGGGCEWRSGSTLCFPDIEKVEVAEGVSIIRTPGHAQEHISVVVRAHGKTTVVAGDAINEEYYRTRKVTAFTHSEGTYRASADYILGIADHVIPGHGAPFDVIR